MRSDFPPFRDTPIRLAVQGGGQKAVAVVASEVRHDPGVAAVDPPRRLSGGWTVARGNRPRAPSCPSRARTTVRRLRDLPEPPGVTTMLVTGASAHFVDFQSSLEEHLPLALAIVVITTFMVLFLFTGSVVLPIKALVMNALTLSAVFGILVLVFQDGNLEGLLDYRGQGALEQTMPILLFAVAFGLSTDYARVPALADQGGPRRRRERLGVGRDRPRAHGADRHRRRAPVLDRDRRLRDLADHLHQGERAGHRARGADRREHHPGPAGALADGAARQVELVGAPPAAPPARADRGRPRPSRPSRRGRGGPPGRAPASPRRRARGRRRPGARWRGG